MMAESGERRHERLRRARHRSQEPSRDAAGGEEPLDPHSQGRELPFGHKEHTGDGVNAKPQVFEPRRLLAKERLGGEGDAKGEGEEGGVTEGPRSGLDALVALALSSQARY